MLTAIDAWFCTTHDRPKFAVAITMSLPAGDRIPTPQQFSSFTQKFTLATGPILPLDNYPGDATALQVLGHGQLEAIAEPVRLGGGSALVVHRS